MVVGAWFEAAFSRRDTDRLVPRWLNLATLGADYTFGVGNGLHALIEHMVANSTDDFFTLGEVSNATGLSLSYPAGYIDRLSAIAFYAWDGGGYSQHVAWDHYWERLSLNVSLFYYPEDRPETPGGVYNPAITRGGRGGQVMLIFNH